MKNLTKKFANKIIDKIFLRKLKPIIQLGKNNSGYSNS